MYSYLLPLHSVFRYLVLLSLLYATFRAFRGYFKSLKFTKHDNHVRHWTATIAHIQLIFGIFLYLKSPLITYFYSDLKTAVHQIEISFFGLYHFILMFIAIVIITFGSALAKRKGSDKLKFKTMLIWFSIGLVIIFLAIPWSFSPFVNRPLFRSF